ncbi:9843_t:CDS:2 [Funneliformis mosseae]|uniref:9843_t:CDS:1 n=1 Tax=Funneliformis mosseae TaxID=27381 RepID=A0A9N9EN96_FUNMO|nr:9843_t:CDS:2 [Funneliformis mosseae]
MNRKNQFLEMMSDNVRGINQKLKINLENNSNDQIDSNITNHLITHLNSNNSSNQIIRNRNKWWLGRKRIEDISNLANQSGLKDIGCANISQNNPLEVDEFLIIFSNQKLCLRKILAMYKSISEKHSFISRSVDNIDLLSYISVTLFIDIYGRSFFTNDCLASGKLFTHITLKEVVYHLKKSSITFHNNSMLTLDSNSLQIYNFLNNSNTQAQFTSIFHNQNHTSLDNE